MKLLKFKIENKEGFRSLQQGFEISFHTLEDAIAMEQFRPFCFAGLNGSGKSNVLEALANIFYHLELCVANYLPESIKSEKNFKRNQCSPDAFALEYLIPEKNARPPDIKKFFKVTVSKSEGLEPEMKIKEFPFNNTVTENIIFLKINEGSKLSAPGKSYLPDHVIGYSSGENEILSLPFIKSRLIHLDEYRQATRDNYERYSEPENSLIYIDSNMSQAVLLSCLLFESEEALAPLRSVDNTGILGLRSFRMNIHLHDFEFGDNETKETTSTPIIKLIEQHQLQDLKKCATSWYLDKNTQTLWLDFYVNDATKAAFREYFHTPLECFQLFRLLYELNNHFVDEQTKQEVYRSKGVYTDGKLPIGSPRQDVFHFLDFYITKELKNNGGTKDLLLRSFSDGEHQFIHTMGICLLMKGRRVLLLLDEPETHFNPSWRAKFIKILNDSISAGNHINEESENFNVHILKDILLSSHSPFIISDCLPDNVVLFEKDETGNTTAKKASDLGIDTYGTSVNILTNKIFGNKNTIGEFALKKLNELKERLKGDKDKFIEEVNIEFGDSIEKLLAIREISE